MDAEERIQMLKQTPPPSKVEKRRKIMTAIVLSLATLLSVLFFIFAFIQKLEADKQKVIATQSMVEAQKQREEAEKQRVMALAAQAEAERQYARAAEALKNCEKSKR